MIRITRRRSAAAVAGIASGVLLWLSSPSVGAGWLAWIAIAPAAAVAIGHPHPRGARLAVPLAYAVYLELMLVPALPFGLAAGQWGDPALPLLIGDSPVVPVALVGVPLVGAALYATGFGLPWGASALATVLGPAAAWTILDVLRVQFDPGGLWGPLFLSQHDTVGGELATIGGPALLTFAIVAVNYAVALAAMRGSLVPVAAAAGCLLGSVAVASATASAPANGALPIAVIQPGYDTAEEGRPETRWFEAGTRDRAALDTVRDLGRLTRQAAARGADLVVWPEAALWVDPVIDRRVRAALRSLARGAQVALVVPYFLPRLRQGATRSITADGRFGGAQPKQRPMWFLGEDGGNRAPPHPVALGSLQVGSMLGIDNQSPGLARALTRSGAGVITSSTHDWPALAVQQRALAQLSATSLREPVARSDWRYGSAIFDAGGAKVADTGPGKTRGALVATVHPGSGETLYARAGQAVTWMVLGLAFLLALGERFGLRRWGTRGEYRPVGDF